MKTSDGTGYKSLYNFRGDDHRHWHGGYVNKKSTSFSLPGHIRHGILVFTFGAKYLKIDTEWMKDYD